MNNIFKYILQKNNFFIIIFCFLLFSSIFALSLAYVSQYVFDYQPCILCLYQRIPFFIIVILSLIALFLRNKFNIAKIIILFCLISLITNVFIAFYHSGVELKYFKGYSGCSAQDLSQIRDINKLREIIMNAKQNKCDEPQLFILGLSMAMWNFIYCLCLLIVIISLTYYYGFKKIISISLKKSR